MAGAAAHRRRLGQRGGCTGDAGQETQQESVEKTQLDPRSVPIYVGQPCAGSDRRDASRHSVCGAPL
nr:hypothetical protein XACS582_10920005 [Xanthomonas citri pv. citri]CEH62625.1 hypothetical protein XACLG97_8730005 [Xanthomonas citri pv. citri]